MCDGSFLEWGMFRFALAMAHIVKVMQMATVFAAVLESWAFMSPELGWGLCAMAGFATVGAKCGVGLRGGLVLFVGLVPHSFIGAACEFLESWRRDAERLPDSFDSINLSIFSRVMSCFASPRRSN